MVEMPRINARQRNRENHPADSAEEYYRRHVLSILGRLFTATTREVLLLRTLRLFMA